MKLKKLVASLVGAAMITMSFAGCGGGQQAAARAAMTIRSSSIARIRSRSSTRSSKSSKRKAASRSMSSRLARASC